MAALLRSRQLSWQALVVGTTVLVVLFAAAMASIIVVVKGPGPIDPSAETLQNVEPIDLDTDAETMDAAKRATAAVVEPANETEDR
jgi:hypothetical protein